MSGQATSDGGRISDDGTTYTSATGAIHHGITDPVTGQFLENGEVRTIDGHQVYGRVVDGAFYSEDGSLRVSGSHVEHGRT
ncbi:hypothetical protein AB0E08_17770, partial [Streptomyces sp. NPDC048281]|uniref:hypothetical protein n=1 Tax=Streptomyces sp. NPDC048281 TaxID=3154715 RepID=UPI003416945A